MHIHIYIYIIYSFSYNTYIYIYMDRSIYNVNIYIHTYIYISFTCDLVPFTTDGSITYSPSISVFTDKCIIIGYTSDPLR